MTCVARCQALERQYDKKIGAAKFRIPCRFAAYQCAEAQIAVQQRRDGGCGGLLRITNGQCAMWYDPPFART